jgi:hypothetical protein
MIEGITAAEYINHRDKIAPFLQGFARRSLGRWTPEQLEMDIIHRDKQVWSIHDFQALCLTSVGPEAVNVLAASGVRRHEWQDELDDILRHWARQLGKRRIIALVRPGWSRFGRARGYREAHREMVLEL